MPTFAVSIINTNSEYDVNGDGSVITFIDHSNYDTNIEAGHGQSDFSNFKKIHFTNPDGTEYTFSTLGDGDALIVAPSASLLPITTLYNYTTGDGVYKVCLSAVPTWDVAVTYSNTNSHCVYYDGNLYEATGTSTGEQPDTSANFQLITVADLPSKYRYCHTFALICNALICFMNSVHEAYCGIDTLYCGEDLCKNKNFLTTMKLSILIDQINILADAQDWAKVVNVINLIKQICCCSNE